MGKVFFFWGGPQFFLRRNSLIVKKKFGEFENFEVPLAKAERGPFLEALPCFLDEGASDQIIPPQFLTSRDFLERFFRGALNFDGACATPN